MTIEPTGAPALRLHPWAGRIAAPALALIAVALIGGPSPVAAEEPGDAAALIDRVLETYGGRDALSRVSSYRAEGSVLTGHAAPPAPTTRIFALPCRLRVVLEYDDRTETRIVDGSQGWRSASDGTLNPAAGPLLDSMRLQCARAALPWILDTHRDQARIIEPGQVPGGELLGLEVGIDQGLALRAYVHPESGHILRSLTVLEHPQMKLAFETRYSDFRSVNGVLFPHREENYTGGRHTASTSLESVVAGPEIDEGTFRP